MAQKAQAGGGRHAQVACHPRIDHPAQVLQLGQNVLWPKRSGNTNSPVSSTPLPLRLRVTAETAGPGEALRE